MNVPSAFTLFRSFVSFLRLLFSSILIQTRLISQYSCGQGAFVTDDGPMVILNMLDEYVS